MTATPDISGHYTSGDLLARLESSLRENGVDAGGKPLHRALALIHGALAEEIMANTGRALRERSTVPIEIVCTKTPHQGTSRSDGSAVSPLRTVHDSP